MKKTKQNIKHWIQKKVRSFNYLLIEETANQIAYIHRVEYFNNLAINSINPGISGDKYCDKEIIISLTTYGKRLYEVYLTIESIMQQTLKPNKIVLWLSYDLENTELPIVLKNQQKRGLEIRFCKDIRSYTKLIPSLKTFPEAVIITIDDDILYNFDLIENLFNAYLKNKGIIHCTRMHRMKLLKQNTIEKYDKWFYESESLDFSSKNFPTGIGGVLYPPNCFNEEVFNETVFLDICKYADDVWFKAMALYNGTMSQKILTHNKNGNDYFINKISQYTSLSSINSGMQLNDIQIKAVFDKYNLYNKL